MGGIISGISAFVASCAGSAFCQLLSSCCPQLNGPIGTRLTYAAFLLFTAVLQCIGMAPGLVPYLARIPRLCPKFNSTDSDACKHMTGYLCAYKIGFGYLLFCMLMALFTIHIQRKSSLRAKIHNNAHGLKFLLVLCFLVAGFATPTTEALLGFVRFTGLIGGLLFIMIQLVCVVDFAHLLNESWLERIEAGGSPWWTCAQLTVSIGSVVGAIVIYTLTLLYYGHSALHLVPVCVNIVFSLVSMVVSILPVVQEHQPSSGLLQACLVSLYVSYLTWTAISSDPSTNFSVNTSRVSSDLMFATTLTIFILSVLYSVFTNTVSRRVNGTDEAKESSDGEDGEPEYSYPALHGLLALASLYVTMTLTSWLKPTSNLHSFVKNQGAFWVKTSSCWACWAVYIWTCIAPCLFPDRDFS